ncbi:MAG: hypothetical protein ORN49_05090 [Rhodobacteraceae bacterium]|nr:hypothetical protein [Paracoccaceae bacterium]
MTKLPDHVFLTAKTMADTAPLAFAEEMFAILDRPEHRVRPKQIWGDREKHKTIFSGIDSAAPFWTRINRFGTLSFLSWSSPGGPRSKVHFRHPFVRSMDGVRFPGDFSLTAAISRKVDWQKLFERLCAHMESGDAFLAAIVEYHSGISMIQDRDRPWIDFHGHSACLSPRYLTDAILASVKAEGFPTGEIGTSRLVSVSDNIFDALDRADWYAERQALLRKLLNPEDRRRDTRIYKFNPDGSLGELLAGQEGR